MIDEAEHTYRDVHPTSVIVKLTEENWQDVAEWSSAEVVNGYSNYEDPTDREDAHLIIPGGDYDDVYAYLGNTIVKNGPFWIAYTEDEWGEPGDFGAMASLYVKVEATS